MRIPSFTTQFQKDVKRVKKRGKDPEKLKQIMSRLIDEDILEEARLTDAIGAGITGGERREYLVIGDDAHFGARRGAHRS